MQIGMCIWTTRDVISTRRVSYEWGCTFLKWKSLTPPNLVTRWYTAWVVGVSASSARSPLGAYCMWCSDFLMQTSALIKHAANDRSFSKRRGSSFQGFISIASFSLSAGHRFRSYRVSLSQFLYCLNGLFYSMDLTSLSSLIPCHADIS